jgi:hypothetical protein
MEILTSQDKKTLNDINIIIKMMPSYMQQQIPQNFKNFVTNNMDMDYTSNINPSIPLRNQELSLNTEIMLALIYREFLCSLKQRNELISLENNTFNITYVSNESSSKQNTYLSTVVKHENLLKRFFNRFKNFFNIHNNS